MALTLVITNAGRAALVNAAANGTNAVQIASVGVSQTAVQPAATATMLPGELKRIATISGDKVAADVIHLVVRDESAAVYTLRSFALYLADGTLFAIYGQAGAIIEKSAQALLLLAIDVTVTDVSAAQITFGSAGFLNPPATVDRVGVVELATDEEAAALTDALRALTPKAAAAIFTAANILSRLLTVDGAGSGLDADMVDGRHVGTSGAALAALDGNNDWSGQQTFTRMLLSEGTGPAGALVGGFEWFNGAAANGWFSGVHVHRPDNAIGMNFTDLRFFTTNVNAAERMRITSDGNLGVGITSPAHRLHVGGDIGGTGGLFLGGGVRSTRPAAAAPGTMIGGHEIFHRSAADGWWAGMRAYVPDDASGLDQVDLRFYTTFGATGERMRISSSGNIGIGTAAPSYRLHVVGSAGFDGPVTINGGKAWTAANDGAGSGLDADMVDGRHVGVDGDAIASLAGNNAWTGRQSFYQPLRGIANVLAGGVVGGHDLYNSDPASGWFAGMRAHCPSGSPGQNFVDLRFYTTNVNAGERMRITADGRVGIGITAPAHQLHVAGGIGATGGLSLGGPIQSTRDVAGTAGTKVGGHEMFNRSIGDGWWAGMRAYVPETAAGLDFVDLRFYTTLGAAGERMRLTPGGDLGIGTTAPNYRLHVVGNVGFDGPAFRHGSGRYLHHADPNIGGETITRGANAPAGGTDGDIHLQVDPAAGKLRVWYNHGSQWLGS
jgi:hypothetical protein